MGRIRKLPPEVSNKIAAGEVVERPASVVKELVENALDADAKRISVELEQGGKQLIRVTDDGTGMEPDDLAVCFSEHATSKLAGADDLSYIDTMGFRGEALPSIGSISHARIVSRARREDGTYADAAHEITNHGGEMSEVRPASGSPGTMIEIANLFFNTPVRRRFLRQNSTEVSRCVEVIQQLALAWPEVGFSLTSDGRRVFGVPPEQDRRERIIAFEGKGIGEDLIEVNDFDEYCSVTGYVGSVTQHRPNSRNMHLFVNRRSIRDRSLLQAVMLAFREYIPHGRYPVCWLFLELDPSEVDVNVHPTKIEVRFVQANRLFGRIKSVVQEAVLRTGMLPRVALDQKRIDALRELGRLDGASRSAAMSALLPPLPEARPGGQHEPGLGLATPGYDSPDEDDGGAGAGPGLLEQAQLEAARSLKQKSQISTHHGVTPGGGAGVSPAEGEMVDEGVHRPDAPPGLAAAYGVRPVAIEKPRQTDLLASARGVFQIAETYIVIETDDGMALVDQHAFHERILFWKLEHRLETNPPEMQRLLVPEPLELSKAASAMVADHRELFRKFGFEIEEFGSDGWACYALPRYVRTSKVGEFVASTLEELASTGRPKDPASLRKAMVEMMACRAAIKAGDSLSGAEIEALLREGATVPHTFSCPHGRPTTFRMTLSDLERLFHRR